MPLARLAAVPWSALRAASASAAIARCLSGEPAERVLDRALRADRALDRAGRAALSEAVFGVALWRRRLAVQAGLPAAPAAGDSSLLLFAFLRALAGLDEADAARLAGTSAPLGPEPRGFADRWSLPDWLAEHLSRELGDEAEPFCAACAGPGPIALRANRLRTTRGDLALELARAGIRTRPGAHSPLALVVESDGGRPNLFGAAAFRAGLFEVQDEGSQLVGLLADARPGETVLDLCAGAGGKALLLAAEGAEVIAHDVDGERLGRLRQRAQRAGAARVRVAPPQPCDVALVDAPCSELGTLRRGPDLRWRLDPAALARLPALQRELLDTAGRLARRRLVYATCTLARAENEDVARAFGEEHPEWTRVRLPGSAHGFFRTLPHREGTDGFFAAVWERR